MIFKRNEALQVRAMVVNPRSEKTLRSFPAVGNINWSRAGLSQSDVVGAAARATVFYLSKDLIASSSNNVSRKSQTEINKDHDYHITHNREQLKKFSLLVR